MASGQRVLLPAPPNWPGRDPDKPEHRRTPSKKGSEKISVACVNCRKRKSKCDGQLPCAACRLKQLSCEYEQEPGVSRVDKLKAQVARFSKDVKAYASIFHSLRNAPDKLDQLNSVLNQMDFETPIENIARSVSATEQSPATPMEVDLSRISSETRPRSESFPETSVESDKYAVLQGSLSTIIDFTSANIELIDRALAAYRDMIGPVFHVYGAEEVEELRLTMHLTNSDEWTKLLLCKVLGIASLGSLNSKNNVPYGARLCFFNLSKLLIDDVVESRELETVKVLAIPVLYNLMDNALVALAYIEAGLSFSEISGLARGLKPDTISEHEWRDKRNAWRTLVLYKAWIQASQGSLSDIGWQQIRSTMLTLTEDIELGGDPTDAVQLQIIKVAVIKHRMLHAMYKNNNVTAFELQNTSASLEEWYDELPECMRLQNAEFSSLHPKLRSRILYVHFLYLGVIILVHRQVLSSYLHQKKRHLDISPEFSAAATAAAAKGFLASEQSSRTLVLLLSGAYEFCPCWLCVFQTFTCAAVLLHDVGQRVINNGNLDSCSKTLEHVTNCIDCLSRTESTDPVVHRVQTTLRGYYHTIAKQVPIFPSEDIFEARENSMQTASYLDMLTDVPTGQSPLHKAVRGLLDMLRRPFNGTNSSNPLNRLEEGAHIGVDGYIPNEEGQEEQPGSAQEHSHGEFDDNRITAHLLGNLDHGYISGTTLPPGWMQRVSPSSP